MKEFLPDDFSALSIALFLFSGVLYLVFYYFKQRASEIAKKSSLQALTEYKNELEGKTKTQHTLAFRDEELRNELLKHVALKSIDKKIGIWQELYRLYFDYKKSWDFDKGTPLKEFKVINDNLKRNQKEILINSVYLGGSLTLRLSKLNGYLIDLIRMEFNLNKKMDNPAWIEDTNKKSREVERLIGEIQQEINSTLFTDQSLKSYEFTASELKKINKLRKTQVKNHE